MKNKYILLSVLLAATSACLPIPSIDDENDIDSGQEVIYPVATYTFEGTAADISGNGYDGVLNGKPEFINDTPDGSGSALRLNGFKSQFVNIPYALLAGLEQYTFSIWIKDFSQGVVFSAEGGNDCPYLYVRDSQKFMLANHWYINEHADWFTFSYDCTNIMSSQWHHIAITSDKGSICLYVDGIRQDSLKNEYSVSTCTKVYLGGNADGKYDNYMSMKIDNVMFFDCCLTPAEVCYIYQNKL